MTRGRVMRPTGPDTFDVVIDGTRRGRIRRDTDGAWRADYMVGENPQRYPIEGAWAHPTAAAEAVDEYSVEQGRISQAQIAYERANGWSTD